MVERSDSPVKKDTGVRAIKKIDNLSTKIIRIPYAVRNTVWVNKSQLEGNL